MSCPICDSERIRKVWFEDGYTNGEHIVRKVCCGCQFSWSADD